MKELDYHYKTTTAIYLYLEDYQNNRLHHSKIKSVIESLKDFDGQNLTTSYSGFNNNLIVNTVAIYEDDIQIVVTAIQEELNDLIKEVKH